MSTLILKVISGPKAGLSSPVMDGLSIGRKKTQIALDDPKSSNLHAIIENNNGVFVLVDQKSRNGIKFKGKRVDSLTLEPGLEFIIGSSLFKVEAIASKKKSRPKTIEKPNTSSLNMEKFEFQPLSQEKALEDPSSKVIDIEPAHWSDVIKNFVNDHEELLKDKDTPVWPFKNLIELKVIRGVQAGKSWTLSYGPRKAGRTSLDIQLFDKAATDICFELLPTNKGCEFKTNYPNKVLLDGKKEKSKVLTGGEIITIGITEIQVGFIYE